jgi:hypothetical protein
MWQSALPCPALAAHAADLIIKLFCLPLIILFCAAGQEEKEM